MKRITIFLLIVLMPFLQEGYVSISDDYNDKSVLRNLPVCVDQSEAADEYGVYEFGMAAKQRTVSINGLTIDLYPEFIDSETAISKLYNKYSIVFNEVLAKLTIQDMNCSNFKTIVFYLYENLEKVQTYVNHAYQEEMLRDIRCFLDIFENTEKNDLIIDVYNSSILNYEMISIMQYMLPYEGFMALVYDSNTKTSRDSEFNINNGVAYAANWATSANFAYHYYPSGDCTNFCSQILEAGGVSQQDTGNESTGWWYHHLTGVDQCSESWRLAHKFCLKWGVDYATTSHYLFSAHIRKGSFISLDYAHDGDWDHVGFVTDREATYSPSLGYTNYKVAQHGVILGSNYNAWANTSTNGWDAAENGTAYYGVVRY